MKVLGESCCEINVMPQCTKTGRICYEAIQADDAVTRSTQAGCANGLEGAASGSGVVKWGVSVRANRDGGMLRDADDVEKSRYQPIDISKLNLAILALALGNPVQQSSCRRKVNADEFGAGNHQHLGAHKLVVQLVEHRVHIALNLA